MQYIRLLHKYVYSTCVFNNKIAGRNFCDKIAKALFYIRCFVVKNSILCKIEYAHMRWYATMFMQNIFMKFSH